MTVLPWDPVRDIASENDIPVMENAVYYHNDTDGFWRRDPPPTTYVIDSGGYTAMDQFGGEFPWTVVEYDRFLREMYDERPFEWAAVMDLACESDFDDILSVEERVDRTIENTVALFDRNPAYPVLPVLQGRTIEEYIECYERLVDHGIDCSYVGLGTVCRLSRQSELRDVERAIRTRTGVESIHAFGVKISSFDYGVTFETVDSKAWSWKLMFGLQYEHDGADRDGIPALRTSEYDDDKPTAIAKQQSFRSYYQRANALHNRVFGKSTTVPTSLNEY